MSRYNIPSQNPALTIIIGWDNPLQTFFAQALYHLRSVELG